MNSVSSNNAIPGPVRESRHCETVRNIHFTLVYDVQTDQVTLGENQTVQTLESIIESRFKIPVKQQVVYGWPGKEPRDSSVKIKDLGLDTEVLLYVAVDGFLEPDQDEDMAAYDMDGTKPGTSRQLTSQKSSPSLTSHGAIKKSRKENLLLHITDQKNGETYSEMPFQVNKSLRDVKDLFAGITGIPIQFQHWSGWPENVNIDIEDQLLQNMNLDKPFHSLFLNDQRDLKNDEDEPSENVTVPVQNSSGYKTEITARGTGDTTEPAENSNSAQTARKSTSKAAMRELVLTTSLPTSKKRVTFSNIGDYNQEKENGLNGQTFVSHNNFSDDESVSASGSGVRPLVIMCNENLPENDRKRATISPHETTPKKIKLTTDNTASPSPCKSPKRHRGLSLLTALPEKAIHAILQYLDPISHLSLRRVCKTTMEWVSGGYFDNHSHIDEEKWKKFSLTITGEDHKTFGTVVNMNLPITRFTLGVKDELFYHHDDLDAFIRHCSLRIRDITLHRFFMFQISNERKLFESLINIEKLTLNEVVIVETLSTLPCPSTLGNLQILKINYEIDIPQENVLVRPKSWDMTWSMLSDCHSLLYFRFPRIIERRANDISNNYGIFAPLLEYISMRVNGGGVSLEYLDLKHFKDPDSFYINRFVDLIRRCYQRDIKVKNVQSLVIQQVFDEDGSIDDEKYKFCENIVSLINYSPFIENAPLRNLEKITVDVIPSSTDYETLGKCYKDMFWPKLRVIKIKDSIQQNKSEKLWMSWQEVQEDLYGHDGTFDRGSVRYIQINSPKLPYFLSEGRLAQRFYNLTRLEILAWCSNDNCLNRRLHALWKKLRLEELRIENCPKLNDGSFEQHFLRLVPTLKKLTLGLDGTDVTDKSFIKIFSYMRLKTFILLSSMPTKISEKGLLKLRERDFGEHIEYFPFHCWSSLSIDDRRFERLSKSFRSMR